MQFLIDLHITMFFALIVAGTICAIWGLVLLIARNRAMKRAAPAIERPGEQKGAADSAPAATGTPAADAPAADAPAPTRKPLITPLFGSALRITAALALIQAIIGGALLFILHLSPPDQLHYVYGGVVLLAIPVAFVYVSGKPERVRRDLLYLTIAALIVAAAAVRAAMTGGFQF